MKKFNYIIVATALLGFFLMPLRSQAGVRVYVKIGPPRRHVVTVYRPARHHRDAIWVDGYYRYRGGRYLWAPGHYIRPRRAHVYVRPHWKKTRRGYYFVPGHWVKR